MVINIKRTGAYGDVFYAEPIITHFVEQGESVNLITSAPDLCFNIPGCSINSKDSGDIINLDWAYESNPKIHITEAYRIASGIKKEELLLRSPKLYLTDIEKKTIKLNSEATKDKTILLLDLECLHYLDDMRRVYGVDWKKVKDFLRSKNIITVQLIKNKKANPVILGDFLATGSTFRGLIPAFHSADMFLGVCSGPSCIAESIGIPSAIIMGGANPKYRFISPNLIPIRNECSKPFCYHSTVETTVSVKRPCELKLSPPTCCSLKESQIIEAIEIGLKL